MNSLVPWLPTARARLGAKSAATARVICHMWSSLKAGSPPWRPLVLRLSGKPCAFRTRKFTRRIRETSCVHGFTCAAHTMIKGLMGTGVGLGVDAPTLATLQSQQ